MRRIEWGTKLSSSEGQGRRKKGTNILDFFVREKVLCQQKRTSSVEQGKKNAPIGSGKQKGEEDTSVVQQ